jgi:hypothetical protein
MRCYIVEGKRAGVKRYAATQALAREARDEIAEANDLKKKEVTITEHDVPLAKAALIEYLNDLVDKDVVDGPLTAPAKTKAKGKSKPVDDEDEEEEEEDEEDDE